MQRGIWCPIANAFWRRQAVIWKRLWSLLDRGCMYKGLHFLTTISCCFFVICVLLQIAFYLSLQAAVTSRRAYIPVSTSLESIPAAPSECESVIDA